MIWLVAGILLWMIVHLSPALMPGFRRALIDKLGEGPYKGLFALDIVIAIVLIVIGWRSTAPEIVYLPPAWGHSASLVLMVVSVYLLGAANMKTAIKRFIRHPQLTGVVVWSIAHLLSNGDVRSVILFGGLGIWALVEIPLISRREGAWVKPEAPPLTVELRGVVIAAIVYVVLVFLHPYFAGVSPMPR